MGLALLGDKLSAEQAQAGNDLAGGGRRAALRHRTADGAAFCLAADLWPGLIKQAINAAETNTLDAQLDLERDYQRWPDAATTTGKASARSGKTRAELYGEIRW